MKPRNCRFPSSEPRYRPGSEGVVLAVVMLIITLLLVALTASLPSLRQEGQREREEELLFRGNQYARAVALFHRQFNRYPVNIKELMGTNNMKFLRQEYRDPVDRAGKWRFVHANAMGALIDSRNQPLSPNLANQNNPSSNSSASGSSPMQTGLSSTSSENSSSSSGSETDTPGNFIVGVAPISSRTPIRNCDNRQHYDEWEFIGVDMVMLAFQRQGVTCFSPFSPGIAQLYGPQTSAPLTNLPGSPPPGGIGSVPATSPP
jgi:type II secretory pathway pseudopilin PulG